MGPVNNARDPLKKQKNTFFFLHGTHSAHSQKKKKAKMQTLPLLAVSKRVITASQLLYLE